jgi:hypothetical protein
MTGVVSRLTGIGSILALTAAVLLIYWPVTGYDFISLDDNLYVVENASLQKGISLTGLAWAMGTFHTTNWHPLTWLSILADYELFGLNPAGYDFGNLILHLINTLLLFLLLRRVSLRIKPDFEEAHNNLRVVYACLEVHRQPFSYIGRKHPAGRKAQSITPDTAPSPGNCICGCRVC